ncbi:hypothetical protein BaRGS_00016277 [Batillaria attramentaria]|uniref:Ig-like domain-containing protein n=1 Tax=Batillaria attramentaria TaxID=370345 RepID=A0ABD0KYW4_9CAEN
MWGSPFLLCLALVTPLHTATTAPRVICHGRGLFVWGRDTLVCRPSIPSNTITWSLVPADGGPAMHLATCPGQSPYCTTLRPVPDMSIRRHQPETGVLEIFKAARNMSGTYVCSELHSDGPAESANSVLMDCNQPRGVQVEEGDYLDRLSCHVFNRSRAVTWSLITPSGLRTLLGVCHGARNCSTPLGSYVTLDSYLNRFSLTINRIKRETSGTLVCSDGIHSDTCPLNVYNRLKGTTCSPLQFNHANWSAIATCDVTSAYSAVGRFFYTVHMKWPTPVPSPHDHPWEWDVTGTFTLPSFTDNATGREDYSGRCTLSWPLPVVDGRYSYITETFSDNYIGLSGTFTIQRPSPPSVQCEGALRDAGRVPCVCSTSSLGSPAGRLIWFSGDTVLAAGQYGVTSLQFPADKTPTKCDVSFQMTCQVDWIIKENISVTTSVACTSQDALSSRRLQQIVIGVEVGLVLVLALCGLLIILWHRQTLTCLTGLRRETHHTVDIEDHEQQQHTEHFGMVVLKTSGGEQGADDITPHL